MALLTTTDLAAARAFFEEQGGWLLDEGGSPPVYLATDDEGIVRDLRGDAFITRCEAEEHWDETVPKHLMPFRR